MKFGAHMNKLFAIEAKILFSRKNNHIVFSIMLTIEARMVTRF